MGLVVVKGIIINFGINWKKEKFVICKYGNKCECVIFSESFDIDYRL